MLAVSRLKSIKVYLNQDKEFKVFHISSTVCRNGIDVLGYHVSLNGHDAWIILN